jgi:hypothetical protein
MDYTIPWLLGKRLPNMIDIINPTIRSATPRIPGLGRDDSRWVVD